MDNIDKTEKLLEKWQHSVVDYLPKLALALIVLLLCYLLARLFRNLSLRFYSRLIKKESSAPKVISVVIYIFFLMSGTFLALEILGLESVLTKLIAGAGIISVVAGFAFKDIASNAFAGLLLSLQHPFKAGDWVEIDGNFGTIKEIGWITTSIKSIEGQEIFVPNQIIYSDAFKNFSTFNKRRIVLKSGVSYGDDLDHVKEVALDEVRKISVLLKDDPVDFYFTGIGSSTYNFEVRFWIEFTQQKDYLNAMSETIIRIKKRFEKEDISIAYSVTTLDFGVKGGVNLFDQEIQIAEKN